MYDATMLCYITTLTLRYRIGPIENMSWILVRRYTDWL